MLCYELSVCNDLCGFGDMYWDGVLMLVVFVIEIVLLCLYGCVKWVVFVIVVGYLCGVLILCGV